MEKALLVPLAYALATSTVLVGLGWRPWSAGQAPRTGRLANALGPAAIFLAVWYGMRGELPPAAPREAQHWIAYGVLAAGIAAWLEAAPLVWFLAVAGIMGGAAHLGYGGLLERRVGPWAWAWVAGIAVVAAGAGAALQRGARSAPRRTAWAAIAVLTATAVVERSRYAGGSLFAGGTCFLLGGLWVASLWRRGWPTLAGLAAPLAALFAGILAVGHLSGRTPLGATLALAALPHVAWPRGRARWVVALVALGLAAYAIHASWPEPDPYDY